MSEHARKTVRVLAQHNQATAIAAVLHLHYSFAEMLNLNSTLPTVLRTLKRGQSSTATCFSTSPVSATHYMLSIKTNYTK
jgi:hypothetical protein